MWMPILLILYGGAVALPSAEECARILGKGRNNEALTSEEIETLSKCKPYGGILKDGDYAIPAQKDGHLNGVPEWQ